MLFHQPTRYDGIRQNFQQVVLKWKFAVKLLVIGLGSVVSLGCILNHASLELHFTLEHLEETGLKVKFGETRKNFNNKK